MQEVTWNCRFHPFDSWHEVGCAHKEWTKEELLSALVSKKKFEQSHLAGKTLTEVIGQLDASEAIKPKG